MDNVQKAIDELMQYNSESRFVEKRINSILEDIEDEIQDTFRKHTESDIDEDEDSDIYDPIFNHFVRAFRTAINERFGE